MIWLKVPLRDHHRSCYPSLKLPISGSAPGFGSVYLWKSKRKAMIPGTRHANETDAIQSCIFKISLKQMK